MDSGDATNSIEIRDVEKVFPGSDKKVLRDVNLTIDDGEFFSILGPSGCGKSTLLRILAGFEVPSQGTVRLFGRDVTQVPPNQRDVHLVFQNYALFPHLSVHGNIAFGLKRKKLPKREINERVSEAIKLVELMGREDAKPRQLSGGQQQRVALARALVNQPRALLLDEPLAALDLKLRQAMQEELKRIQREVGITFVYVTHDQGEALAMSDRLAVMDEGVLKQVGTPSEVYESPEDPFVAKFIGSSSLLRGTVSSSNEVILDGGAVLPVTGELDHEAGAKVGIVLRPERIRILHDTQVDIGDGSNLSGQIVDSQFVGSSWNYKVLIAGGEVVRVAVVNEQSDARHFEVGETVKLELSTSARSIVSWE